MNAPSHVTSHAPRRDPARPEQARAHPPPELPDEVLVERGRRGDAAAFRAIFQRYAPRVRRFLRDVLGDSAAADEATQEVFVRAHASLGGMPPRLLPWLFGVAHNVAHEQRRARARLVPLPEPYQDTTPDAGFDPETVLLGREADTMLASALAHLPEDRRAALVLRTDHDLGYDDIASVMGWSTARVKNELHRARLQLRRSLIDYLSSTESGHGA